MLLPYLGGSPSVWNTCVVFFQVMLLGGYLYSHTLPGKIGIRKHAVLHLLLLGVAALLLPIGVSTKAIESLSETSSAPLWLLVTLLTTVGLPFFVLSTTAPLLQSWFSNTGHHRAHDPYFLYAASNLGSLLALLSYPLILEPNLKVRTQSLIWSGVYALAFALIVLCALVAIRTRPKAFEEKVTNDTDYVVNWSKRLRWVVLALVPSSLMLGVTTYISTDLAPVPLFWVVPLSLYLLTFIIQFSGRQPILRLPGRFLLPIFALPVVFSLATGATRPLIFFFPAHLLFFFLACLVCHGQLASDRPPANHLTEFYLWISIGGALGGLFNALVAPVIFRKIVEYPLMVAVACFLRPTKNQATRKDLLAPMLILVCLSAILILLRSIEARSHVFLVALTASLIASYLLVERPVRFGLAILSVFIAAAFFLPEFGRTIVTERNFFGRLEVISDRPGTVHYLMHGTTQHGRQFTDAAQRCEPQSYYHKSGPFGSIASFVSKQQAARVAIVGMGAGTTACYALPGQQWTFYEIDPAIVKIAHDPSLFTYIDNCAHGQVNYVLGDGRLRLKQAPANYYSLIALDAFSSDAIPIHLLTQEAVALYVSKLAERGIVAFHISNRHLELSRALGSVAQTSNLAALIMRDGEITPDQKGKDASIWVVMARSPNDLAELSSDNRWQKLDAIPGFRVWTDDFSNIFSVLRR